MLLVENDDGECHQVHSVLFVICEIVGRFPVRSVKGIEMSELAAPSRRLPTPSRRTTALLPVSIMMHASSSLCQSALFQSSATGSNTDEEEEASHAASCVAWLAHAKMQDNGHSWCASGVFGMRPRCLQKLLRCSTAHPIRVFSGVRTSHLFDVCAQYGDHRLSVAPDVLCTVLVPAPTPGALHFAIAMPSARFSMSEMIRQYLVRCEMARVMTLGGGWASVKNAKEALKCSIRLYELAASIGDEATIRKCRVFVGWAMLWHHQQKAEVGASTAASSSASKSLDKALWIFTTQMDANKSVQDETNWNRCFAALYHWSFLSETAPTATGTDRVDTIGGGTMAHDDNDVLEEWEHLFA